MNHWYASRDISTAQRRKNSQGAHIQIIVVLIAAKILFWVFLLSYALSVIR